MNAQVSSSALSYEHQEHILQTFSARLREIDENNCDLTSFFFAVNTAMLAIVMQLLKEDWQRMVLAIVGYVASVALALIGYKSFWSWRAYAEEMHRLETALRYDISAKYNERLRNSPARSVRVTLVRLRFNFLFLVLWVLVLIYLVFTIPAPWLIAPPFLSVLLGVFMIIATVLLPWLYLTGTLRPGVLWAILRAPWAREV